MITRRALIEIEIAACAIVVHALAMDEREAAERRLCVAC